VAPQALALLNNEFVIARAKEFAERLRKIDPAHADSWVTNGWQIALGRAPTAAERAKALALLDTPDQSKDQSKALADFCLMLFNLNEFIYVE
jgi:hypothetical protein